MAGERASHLTVAQAYDLDHACILLRDAGLPTYQVGSSLARPDWRDVDLRCILPDGEFEQLAGPDRSRLLLFNRAITALLSSMTGLPIDFQFQSMTEANQDDGPRNAMGIRAQLRRARHGG